MIQRITTILFELWVSSSLKWTVLFQVAHTLLYKLNLHYWICKDLQWILIIVWSFLSNHTLCMPRCNGSMDPFSMWILTWLHSLMKKWMWRKRFPFMDNKTGASGVFVKTFTLGVWRQTFTFLSEFKAYWKQKQWLKGDDK